MRMVEFDAPGFVYSAVMQAEDGVGGNAVLEVAVTQTGSAAASRPATLTVPAGESSKGEPWA